MISPETRVQIRRYFYAEHWKIGTIARELDVHPDTVRSAIEVERFQHAEPLRPSIRRSVSAVRARDAGATSTVARHAPLPDDPRPWLHRQCRAVAARRGAFAPAAPRSLSALAGFSGEQAQVDWALLRLRHGGPRQTSTLLLRDHAVLVAGAVSGVLLRPDDGELPARPRARLSSLVWTARVILYDNLKSCVLERRGDQIHFNPRLLELALTITSSPRPCQVRAGNQKGRVERAIRYVRDSFWAGRSFHHAGGVQSPGARVAR